MSRCWGCCQENCGFKNCQCSCHCPESSVVSSDTISLLNPEEPSYMFYAIADRDDLKSARWYRTYSSNSSSGFVDDLEKAKIWSRRGLAKGKATQLGTFARLVEFVVTKVNIIDNSEHIKKTIEKKRIEAEQYQKRLAEARLAKAQAEFDEAKKRLAKLTQDQNTKPTAHVSRAQKCE